MPIHAYLDIMWETKYHPHFYKICHEIILLIHQEIFCSKAPRLSNEANRDLKPLGKWFGEESFTYIRVFGILSSLHVLPLFVPDKILAREIAYQTIGND